MAVVLCVPVLLCAAPLPFSGRRRRLVAGVAAGALGAGIILTALSVGWAYLPSLALLLVGALRTRPS